MDRDTKKVEDLSYWAEEKKAEDIVAVDVSNKSSFTDYFIICSGKGSMHTKAIAKNIMEQAKPNKYRLLGKEGIDNGKWILLDYDDVVIHIFDAPVRNYYKLEELWSKQPNREAEEKKL